MTEQHVTYRLDDHEHRVSRVEERLDVVEIWRAETRGAIRMLGLIAGIGMGLPATVLGVLALTGHVSK